MSRLETIKESLLRVTVPNDGGSVFIRDIRWAVGEIERLQEVIRFCFSYRPCPGDDTDEIGHTLVPMPAHIRETIIATVTKREAVG